MVKVILWKIFRAKLTIATFSVISFIVGLILGKLIDQIVSTKTNLIELVIQGTILLTLLLILYYLSVQFSEFKEILRRQKISVDVKYTSVIDKDKKLYESLNDSIVDAKRSIKVIGLFRPRSLSSKEGRKNYYDVLEEIIEMKIKQNHPFVYERIVQVEQITSEVIRDDQIDSITFEHCEKIFGLKKEKSAVSIYIKQIPNILGALSFLIVDDEKFFISIPDTVRNEHEALKLEGLQLILGFEDAKRVLIEPMNSFFTRIFNEAEPVLKVESKQNRNNAA
jgi:hypothetical protein